MASFEIWNGRPNTFTRFVDTIDEVERQIDFDGEFAIWILHNGYYLHLNGEVYGYMEARYDPGAPSIRTEVAWRKWLASGGQMAKKIIAERQYVIMRGEDHVAQIDDLDCRAFIERQPDRDQLQVQTWDSLPATGGGVAILRKTFIASNFQDIPRLTVEQVTIFKQEA